STPSRKYEKAPTTTSDSTITVPKTGRLTESSASHCMSALLLDERAVGESWDGSRDDCFSGHDAALDLDEAVGELAAELHEAQLRALVLDHEGGGDAGLRSNRRHREDHARARRGQLDSCGREQARGEAPVAIGDERL